MSGHDHGYDKDAIGKRLRRIEGQVRGIEKMVDEERYCIDILTQIGAAMTALENVGLKVLDDHVNHCVAGAIASGDEARPGQRPTSCSRPCSVSRRRASPRRGACSPSAPRGAPRARQERLDEREDPVPARHEDLAAARLDGAGDPFGDELRPDHHPAEEGAREHCSAAGIPRSRRSPAAPCAP